LTDQQLQDVLISDGVFSTFGNDFTIILGSHKDRFAWLDGFRPKGSTIKNPKGAHAMMMGFWKETHQLPFIGDIIYW
jgi:hypothetical protein